MLFRETTSDPQVEALHREVAAASRDALLPLLARETGIGDEVEPLALELFWEAVRAVLQGLALWWYEHPGVPRELLLASAMNALWLGLERLRAGERWVP